MRCVVLAYSNIGCAGIEALVKNGFDVAAVFTHSDKSTENIWFRSVAETAVANNIPVFAPEDINHPIWVQRIKDLKPDMIFSFYYRDLVGKEILSPFFFRRSKRSSTVKWAWILNISRKSACRPGVKFSPRDLRKAQNFSSGAFISV